MEGKTISVGSFFLVMALLPTFFVASPEFHLLTMIQPLFSLIFIIISVFIFLTGVPISKKNKQKMIEETNRKIGLIIQKAESEKQAKNAEKSTLFNAEKSTLFSDLSNKNSDNSEDIQF